MADETDRLHERVAVLEAADRYTNTRVDKLENQIGAELREMRDAARDARTEMKNELSAVKEQVDTVAKLLTDIKEKQASGVGAWSLVRWLVTAFAGGSGWFAFFTQHRGG